MLLDRRSSRLTAKDLVALARDRGIKTVSLLHVGGDGWLKTLDFIAGTDAHLLDVLEGGERADGSSLFRAPGKTPGDSDIMLRPRLETAFLDPFSPHPTLALLCGHAGREGHPLPESPDTIVRRAHARVLEETGAELWALCEVEFFLGKRAEESDAYGTFDRGYHATSPFVFGQGLRRRAMAILGEMGVAVKYGHSEVGYIEASETDGTIWEQHEIELALAPLPEAADAVVLTQWVLRNLAHAEGLRCSFDPIVRKGHAGSGLHVHLSPRKDGEHLAGPRDGVGYRDEARWLIGGLVRLGGALMAFGNRSPGSLVRVGQGKEAPTRLTWGRYNRDALLRLPAQVTAADGRVVSPPTIEFRLPDGSAHPHLLLAGCGQALLEGRRMKDLDEVLERTRVTYASKRPDAATPVPHSFGDIAAELERCRGTLEAGGVFPPGQITTTLERLRAES